MGAVPAPRSTVGVFVRRWEERTVLADSMSAEQTGKYTLLLNQTVSGTFGKQGSKSLAKEGIPQW
jgi:hypothetical protein